MREAARRFARRGIADKLGFGSVEAMHIYLDNLELPAWLSGATSRDEPDEPQRHARTVSEKPAELPPAYDALFLFHRALMKFDCAIGDLENRKEYLQDERFIAHEDTGLVDLPLVEAMGQAISAVSARDAQGFFEHRGYRAVVRSF